MNYLDTSALIKRFVTGKWLLRDGILGLARHLTQRHRLGRFAAAGERLLRAAQTERLRPLNVEKAKR